MLFCDPKVKPHDACARARDVRTSMCQGVTRSGENAAKPEDLGCKGAGVDAETGSRCARDRFGRLPTAEAEFYWGWPGQSRKANIGQGSARCVRLACWPADRSPGQARHRATAGHQQYASDPMSARKLAGGGNRAVCRKASAFRFRLPSLWPACGCLQHMYWGHCSKRLKSELGH
jgi:hypothetical protein